MKKLLFLFLFYSIVWGDSLQAADTVFIKEAQIPVLLERQDNILFYMRLKADTAQTFNEVVLQFTDNTPMQDIQSVKLYYSGTEALQDYGKKRFAPVAYLSFTSPGKTLAANPSYSVLKSEATGMIKREIKLVGNQKLFPGINFFWISLQMKPSASLASKVSAKIISVSLDNHKAPLQVVSPQGIEHCMGIGVRRAGDDASAAYRIPGLVTTNKGTLLGVYDVRYNNSADLQEHVDVGLSRSTNGGRTWEKMRLPLAFGEYGGLPAAQNGVGDPSSW